jgi:hypothetical protein
LRRSAHLRSVPSRCYPACRSLDALRQAVARLTVRRCQGQALSSSRRISLIAHGTRFTRGDSVVHVAVTACVAWERSEGAMFLHGVCKRTWVPVAVVTHL